MTNSTGGGGNWPFERVGGEGTSAFGGGTFGRTSDTPDRPVAPTGFAGSSTAEHASGDGRRSRRGETVSKGRRRPPVWLLVVIGLVVVGGVVAAVFLRPDKAATPEAIPAVTVTLPVPTATVDPIAREAGTAFQNALPSTVLAFALSEIVEDEPLLGAGAVEAWQLTYTDGAQSVVLYAGQFADAATAEAAFDQVLVANPTDTSATDTSATDTTATDTSATDTTATATATAPPVIEPEQGTVEVDGTQVGRFLFLPRDDGTASLWWTNTTVLLQLDGPAAVLRDLYAAFPL